MTMPDVGVLGISDVTVSSTCSCFVTGMSTIVMESKGGRYPGRDAPGPRVPSFLASPGPAGLTGDPCASVLFNGTTTPCLMGASAVHLSDQPPDLAQLDGKWSAARCHEAHCMPGAGHAHAP